MDVRAPEAGVLTALHAAVNDTVAVGAPLFSIDVGAIAAGGGGAAAATPPQLAAAPPQLAAAPPQRAAAPPPPPPPPPAQPPQQHARKPSIAFRHGVRPAGAPAAGSGAAPSSDYEGALAAAYPSKPGAKPELSVPPSFGRPPIGADEAFLIDSGGAFGAPPPPQKGKK